MEVLEFWHLGNLEWVEECWHLKCWWLWNLNLLHFEMWQLKSWHSKLWHLNSWSLRVTEEFLKECFDWAWFLSSWNRMSLFPNVSVHLWNAKLFKLSSIDPMSFKSMNSWNNGSNWLNSSLNFSKDLFVIVTSIISRDKIEKVNSVSNKRNSVVHDTIH